MPHKVLLCDLEVYEDAVRWAREHCISFTQVEEVDVSDVSYEYDTITEFVFTNEADALMFRLKWQ